MENQKEMSYYTPTIEELHIGYQCEITYAKDLIGTRDEYFFKYVVEPQYFNERDYVAIRTPFLTKEQIEAEGWKHTGGELIFSATQYFEKKLIYNDEVQRTLEMRWESSKHSMLIGYDGGDFALYNVFEGEIKSINEFKTLLKWLKIK